MDGGGIAIRHETSLHPRAVPPRVAAGRRQRAAGHAPPALTSKINIGVRHVLALYSVLAIVAAYAAVALWKRSGVATAALLDWFFVAGIVAHPAYLP